MNKHIIYRILILIAVIPLCIGFSSLPDDNETQPIPPSQLATYQKVDLVINGMTCSMCSQGIKTKLTENAAIKYIEVDFDNKIISAYVNPATPINKETFDAIISSAGYELAAITFL